MVRQLQWPSSLFTDLPFLNLSENTTFRETPSCGLTLIRFNQWAARRTILMYWRTILEINTENKENHTVSSQPYFYNSIIPWNGKYLKSNRGDGKFEIKHFLCQWKLSLKCWFQCFKKVEIFSWNSNMILFCCYLQHGVRKSSKVYFFQNFQNTNNYKLRFKKNRFGFWPNWLNWNATQQKRIRL